MNIKVLVKREENSVSCVVTGWVWERSDIYRMAEKIIQSWCGEGEAVGKSWMFGLKVRVTIAGTVKA